MARAVTVSATLRELSAAASTPRPAQYVCQLEAPAPLVSPPDLRLEAGGDAGSLLTFHFPAVLEGGPYEGTITTLDGQGNVLDLLVLPGFDVEGALAPPAPVPVMIIVAGAPVTITIG